MDPSLSIYDTSSKSIYQFKQVSWDQYGILHPGRSSNRRIVIIMPVTPNITSHLTHISPDLEYYLLVFTTSMLYIFLGFAIRSLAHKNAASYPLLRTVQVTCIWKNAQTSKELSKYCSPASLLIWLINNEIRAVSWEITYSPGLACLLTITCRLVILC